MADDLDRCETPEQRIWFETLAVLQTVFLWSPGCVPLGVDHQTGDPGGSGCGAALGSGAMEGSGNGQGWLVRSKRGNGLGDGQGDGSWTDPYLVYYIRHPSFSTCRAVPAKEP